VKLRPRLIPSVILAATVLLGLKVSDIFSVGSLALAQAPSPNQATGVPIDLTSEANAAKAPSPLPAAAKPQDTPATKPAAPNTPTQQATAPEQATAPQRQAAAPPPQATAPRQQAASPAPPTPAAQQSAAAPQQQVAAAPQQAPAPPAPPTDAAKAALPADDAKPAAQTADASAAAGPGAAASDTKPAIKDPLLLSPAEIEVLQELSARRAQLDQRSGDLDQQQVVLQAAEKRIDEKIAKLETLQKSIQSTVDKQNAADDARTQSLVKIYETMKPADAAQILSQLDMPILLQMLSHMKEAKTAPILAAMDPTKAEAITTAMARRQNPPSVPPPAAAPAPANP
jgi:flagellar motility protein MotE (MotC chaperone)